MLNEALKKVVKINNGIGFFLDETTIITAAHNRNGRGLYKVITDKIDISSYGYLKGKTTSITDTLNSGDLQILRDDGIYSTFNFEGANFKNDNLYYLIGRRFKYPCFKHFENIFVIIKYIFPLELKYLKHIQKINKIYSLTIENRIKLIEYCLSALPNKRDKIENYIYENCTLPSLENLHERYSITLWDALLEELSIFVGVINEGLILDGSFSDAASSVYKEILQLTELTSLKDFCSNSKKLYEFGCELKTKLNSMLCPLYHEKINYLDKSIIKNYYSHNKINIDLNDDYIVTMSRDIIKPLTESLILISAPSYPGFSGGPLIDATGRVQGLIVGGANFSLLSTLIPFPKKSQTIVRCF